MRTELHHKLLANVILSTKSEPIIRNQVRSTSLLANLMASKIGLGFFGIALMLVVGFACLVQL